MGIIKRIIIRLLRRFRGNGSTSVKDVVIDELADTAIDKAVGNKNTSGTVVSGSINVGVTNPGVNQSNVQMPNINSMQMASLQSAGVSQNPEALKYLRFNEDMEWIGVTDDAPDVYKMAFLKYQKEKKE